MQIRVEIIRIRDEIIRIRVEIIRIRVKIIRIRVEIIRIWVEIIRIWVEIIQAENVRIKIRQLSWSDLKVGLRIRSPTWQYRVACQNSS